MLSNRSLLALCYQISHFHLSCADWLRYMLDLALSLGFCLLVVQALALLMDYAVGEHHPAIAHLAGSQQVLYFIALDSLEDSYFDNSHR